MLAFFFRLFRRYFPGRKAIFCYWDGLRHVWADPIVLQRLLDKHGGEGWTHHLDVLRLAQEEKLQAKLADALKAEQAKATETAVEELAVLVRKAFDVLPLSADGKGLAESECLNLLASFLSWMTIAEEDARPSQSSPPPTESSPANSTTA